MAKLADAPDLGLRFLRFHGMSLGFIDRPGTRINTAFAAFDADLSKSRRLLPILAQTLAQRPTRLADNFRFCRVRILLDRIEVRREAISPEFLISLNSMRAAAC